MKKKIIIGVLVVVAAAAGFGYYKYNQKNPDLVTKKPDITVNAPDLIAAFEKDTASANRQYLDKVIEVTGTVKSIDTSGVIFLGSPDAQSSVVCGLDERHRTDHAQAKVGSTITVQGRYTGYKAEEMLGMNLGTNVELSFCGVKNKN
jgi:flagellar basal body-associated protein FliL